MRKHNTTVLEAKPSILIGVAWQCIRAAVRTVFRGEPTGVVWVRLYDE